MTGPALLDLGEIQNTLSIAKAVIARSDLVITNDTGARHLAVGLNRPVVTIFGSTDPQRTTLDYPAECIIRADVYCSPCQRRICPQPAGPNYHVCMQSITPDNVAEQAVAMMDEFAWQERGE
jgi:heptosyltransferase-2